MIDFDGPLPEPLEYRPAADRILGGDPVQRVWNLYGNADGGFQCGIRDVRQPARKYYAVHEPR